MCTVSYLPTEEGFILTSNRDESPERATALPPQKIFLAETPLVFPKDPEAAGSWIMSSPEFTLCLLNGGFEKHQRQLPYRRSRGMVLMDFLKIASVDTFFNEFSLDKIEPFTLLILNHTEELTIHELVWDGENKHLRRLNKDKPFIRASSTLYDKRMRLDRLNWFSQWLQEHNTFTREEIFEFHRTAGNGNPFENLLMNRDEKVKTLSITSVVRNYENQVMNYYEVDSNSHHTMEVPMYLPLEA